MSVEVHILASGSDGNCTVVKFEDRAVMVDAGISCKAIQKQMDINGLDASCIESILVTHEHSDHVCGAGATARKLDVPIVCNENTFRAFDFGRVDHEPIRMMNPFQQAGMEILPLPTSHNAAEPCAYLIQAGDERVLIATDTGKLTFPVEHALEEADIAVIESNYDKRMLDYGPYPPGLKKLIDSEVGHMCNVATGEAIKRTAVPGHKRKIFLAHLSRNNNAPDVARETVSKISGIRRMELDCLEFKGDTRILRV